MKAWLPNGDKASGTAIDGHDLYFSTRQGRANRRQLQSGRYKLIASGQDFALSGRSVATRGGRDFGVQARYAAIEAIRDAARMLFERRVTESICRSSG